MIAQAKVDLDEDFFSCHYDDWIEARSRYRRFALLTGIGILGVGIAILFLMSSARFFGLVAISIGLVEIVNALTYKRRWIRKRLGAGMSKTVLEFYDDKINMKSDSSEGHYLISGFVEIIAATRGVFLVPQKGISIYVPWKTIEPSDAIPQVMATLERTRVQE